MGVSLNSQARRSRTAERRCRSFSMTSEAWRMSMAFAAYGEAVRYRGTGPRVAAELGAVATLVRSVGSADFRLPHTGFSNAAGIPAGAVTAEDAQLIADLAAEGRVRDRKSVV